MDAGGRLMHGFFGVEQISIIIDSDRRIDAAEQKNDYKDDFLSGEAFQEFSRSTKSTSNFSDSLKTLNIGIQFI